MKVGVMVRDIEVLWKQVNMSVQVLKGFNLADL